MLLRASPSRPLKRKKKKVEVWLQAGIHIVTPNKKLNSGPLPLYQALRQFQRGSYIHFFYEARLVPGCPWVLAGAQSSLWGD